MWGTDATAITSGYSLLSLGAIDVPLCHQNSVHVMFFFVVPRMECVIEGEGTTTENEKHRPVRFFDFF